MIARFEMGDVLLTTRMNDIFLRFGQSILSRDAPFTELNAHRVRI